MRRNEIRLTLVASCPRVVVIQIVSLALRRVQCWELWQAERQLAHHGLAREDRQQLAPLEG